MVWVIIITINSILIKKYFFKPIPNPICLLNLYYKILNLIFINSISKKWRVWELKVSSSNSAMRSVWEITLCSWFMLTSVLDEAKCTALAHPNPLPWQTRAQRIECHYGHVQVKDANSNCSHLPIFHSSKILKLY